MPEFRIAHRTLTGGNATHETVQHQGSHLCLQRDSVMLWDLDLDSTTMTLTYTAVPGVLHYFRLADATLIPLPPGGRPAHGASPSPLRFSAGDAYIAVSPGAGRIADSPAIARFIHLRDYFNAEKMAEALLGHLLELAGTDEIPEDVTVLVVEAR